MKNEPPSGATAVGVPPSIAPSQGRVVVVTGMSGAGKTLALKALEDVGYEAVDNLPLSLLRQMLRPGEGIERALALGIDIRTREFGADSLTREIDRLKSQSQLDVKLLFLDCEDDILCRRFTETRRRHPLAADRPLLDGILHERTLITPLRALADLVIDTSRQPPGQLKSLMEGAFGLEETPGLTIFVTSFAYRNGLPREADLVFDARFLDNPHYVPELRSLTGRDPRVAAHVAADPDFRTFFDAITSLLAPLLPRYALEGKSYLTIAVGCTGGRHRSVFIAESLAAWLRDGGYRFDLRHREIGDGEQ